MIKNIMKNIGTEKAGMPEKLKQAYIDHAKKISVDSLESLIRNKDKAYENYNDEIAQIYADELKARNPQNLEEEAPAKKDIEQYMKAKRDIKKFKDTFKKQNEEYEARQRMGESASALSPLWGLKPNDYKNDPEYKKAVDIVKAFEA